MPFHARAFMFLDDVVSVADGRQTKQAKCLTFPSE